MAKIITLSGSDGTGKTTLGKLIFSELKKKGYKVEYRVEFNYFLLKYLIKLYEKITSKKSVSQKRKEFLKNEGGLNRIIPYFIYFDLILEYFWVKIFKRGFVIMDRHIIDFIIGWRLIGISNKFVERLFLWFPKVNYPIILIVDPKIAHERKRIEQSNDLNFFIKLDKWTKELGKKKKFTFFDTDKNLDNSVQEILNYIKK